MPDVEVIAAKPTLLTTDGMLLVASSPFGQRGELWRMHREFFGRDDPSILIAHGTTLNCTHRRIAPRSRRKFVVIQ